MITKKNWLVLVDASVISLGIFMFAFFVSAAFPFVLIAILGLLIAVWLMSRRLKTASDIKLKFALNWHPQIWQYLAIGALSGVLVAMVYRRRLGIPLYPTELKLFAIIAGSIGVTEELIFRGYLQSSLYKINSLMAIVFASAAHTIYKALLFLSPYADQDVKLYFLVLWTFVVGLIFGLLTKYAKSIFPALIAHVLFDIFIYGHLSNAPWWVW